MGDNKAHSRADGGISASGDREGNNSARRRENTADVAVAAFSHAFPLINSKLKPPPRAAACIDRKGLVGLLGQVQRKKLVVLAAPSGSGKSTLLSQWYEHTIHHQSVAWLSLDKSDSEPARFFTYLIGAVRGAVADFDAYLATYTPDGTLDPVVTLFVESLGRVGQNLVIVLDDFQWVADPALTRAFSFLVRRSPANVRWIVSGRCMPDLNLSQLKLQDELLVIDQVGLSFDSATIVQLGHKLSGAALSIEDADRIRSRTEGWVAGVKLALLARKEALAGKSPAEGGDQLEGAHCEVARYLAATVLQEQTPEVRDLLIGSSIVDRLNGDLCNALLGITNGQVLLEMLDSAQLFLQPLDTQRHWYRYHTLFLEFLRSYLRRDHADRIPGLHIAASRWYAEHQMNDEALVHAFASEDRAWCIELIGRWARNWLKGGEIANVLRWTARLSQAEILSHEAIATPYIASLILCRRFREAAAMLRSAETSLASHMSTLPVVRARLRTLHMMLAVLSDRATDIDIVDYVPGDERADVYLTGTLMTLQAYWLVRHNRFDTARRLALRARDLLRQQGSFHGAAYAELLICIADRAVGNFESVAETCERMFAEVKNGNRNPAWVNAATPLANLRYEQNRLAEAEALCVEVLPLLSSVSTLENLTGAYLTLARVKAINGRPTEAFQLLDYLHSVLDSVNHRRLATQVCYEKIRLHLSAGNPERAEAVAEDFDIPQLAAQGEWAQPRDYDMAWERLGFARASVLLYAKEYDRCRDLLGVLIASASKVGYVYRLVPLEAMLAVCEWRAGDRAAAFAAVNRGLSLNRRYAFTRSAFDDAPGLQEIITAAVEGRKLQYPLPPKYFEKFEDLFADRASTGGSLQRRKPMLPLEPLTEREIEILLLLSLGLSNQEISEQSQIALSTAKWHLKNIFAKLDVTTRTGALARARALQLID